MRLVRGWLTDARNVVRWKVHPRAVVQPHREFKVLPHAFPELIFGQKLVCIHFHLQLGSPSLQHQILDRNEAVEQVKVGFGAL